MEKHAIRLTLVPLSDEEVRQYGLQDVVALYMDQDSGVVNVGRPSLAPYYPIIANMFGFKKAIEKGYYLKIKEKTELANKQIYSIIISPEQTVTEVSRVNSLLDSEIADDILANYLNKQKIK